jgi:hypothetical protein
MKQPPIISEYQQRPSRFPLWWVLGVNLAVVLLTIQFYWVPKGMGIRPMGWTAWMFMLTVAGLVGIPIVWPTLRRHRRLFWPKLVVIGSLSPLPIAMLIFSHAQHLRGFILEE